MNFSVMKKSLEFMLFYPTLKNIFGASNIFLRRGLIISKLWIKETFSLFKSAKKKFIKNVYSGQNTDVNRSSSGTYCAKLETYTSP